MRSRLILPNVVSVIDLVPKSETRGFDSWLTSSLRIERNFPLATSDVKMMPEAKFYSYTTNEWDNKINIYTWKQVKHHVSFYKGVF